MNQNCTNCGSPLTSGAAFCRSCGTKVEQPNACARCGTSNTPGVAYCAKCGNAMQAQQPHRGTPQRSAQQPATHAGAKLTDNKWVLPGVGAAVAAIVIIAVVLMMGGSGGEKKKDASGAGTQTQAKSGLPPEKVAGASEDLAATIANLNKSQLNVMALTAGFQAGRPKATR